MQNSEVRREFRKEEEPGRDGLLANPDFARQVMDAADPVDWKENITTISELCQIFLFNILPFGGESGYRWFLRQVKSSLLSHIQLSLGTADLGGWR